ncbi:MAG: tetratricopeptide repeat protein [bacterium]
MSEIFLTKDRHRGIREAKRFYFKAQDNLKAGKWIKAIRYLQRSLEMKDDYLPACRDLADIYHQHGDLDQAQKYIQKAVQIDPEDPLSLFFQGVIYLTKKDILSALDSFNRALEHGELTWGLAYNLGLCYYCLEKFDFSRQFLDKAILKDPSQLQPYMLLAQILIIQKKTDLAKEILLRAKKVRPHDHQLDALLKNILNTQKRPGS